MAWRIPLRTRVRRRVTADAVWSQASVGRRAGLIGRRRRHGGTSWRSLLEPGQHGIQPVYLRQDYGSHLRYLE
jgi:hypothetical protein